LYRVNRFSAVEGGEVPNRHRCLRPFAVLVLPALASTEIPGMRGAITRTPSSRRGSGPCRPDCGSRCGRCRITQIGVRTPADLAAVLASGGKFRRTLLFEDHGFLCHTLLPPPLCVHERGAHKL
jgi:hypothetical protein